MKGFERNFNNLSFVMYVTREGFAIIKKCLCLFQSTAIGPNS
jgi:hypothetical protein